MGYCYKNRKHHCSHVYLTQHTATDSHAYMHVHTHAHTPSHIHLHTHLYTPTHLPTYPHIHHTFTPTHTPIFTPTFKRVLSTVPLLHDCFRGAEQTSGWPSALQLPEQTLSALTSQPWCGGAVTWTWSSWVGGRREGPLWRHLIGWRQVGWSYSLGGEEYRSTERCYRYQEGLFTTTDEQSHSRSCPPCHTATIA